MANYVLLPIDWDYDYKDLARVLKVKNNQKIFVPSQIEGVVKCCGSLGNFPLDFVEKYIKNVKRKYPYVKFSLTKGETWGNMELVKEF